MASIREIGMIIIDWLLTPYRRWQRRRLIARLRKQDPFIY